jgi:hypothetical protein
MRAATMLERSSHVCLEAKSNAMESVAVSRIAGYDTNHDTHAVAKATRPV